MNAKVKNSFSEIGKILADFFKTTEAIGTRYAEQKQRNTDFFKDAAPFNTELKASSAKGLADLAESTRRKLSDCKNELQTALNAWLVEMPPETLTNKLRLYDVFHVKASPAELTALLAEAKGNFFSLRVIAGIAEKSGYVVDYPQPEAFENDLKSLNNVIDAIPYTLPGTCTDIAPATRLVHGVQYPVDGLTMSVASTFAKSYSDHLTEASDRWAADVQPTVKQLTKAVESGEIAEDDLASNLPETGDVSLKAKNPFEDRAAHKNELTAQEVAEVVSHYIA